MKILIIGGGRMGGRHAEVLLSHGCELECVDPFPIQENSKYFTKVYNNLNAVKNKKWDHAIIASPANTHLESLSAIADESKSILVEKPLCTIFEEAAPIHATLEEKIKLAYPRRFSCGVQRLVQNIRSGKIGRLLHANTRFSQDYRKYRPDFENIYYAKLRQGGGIIQDALTHHIDLVIAIFGNIQGLYAKTAKKVFSENCEGPDFCEIILNTKSGVSIQMSANQYQKANEDYIEVTGDKGTLLFDRINNTLTFKDSDQVKNYSQEKFNDEWSQILKRQIEALILNNGEDKYFCNFSEGLQNIKVLQAIQKSSESSHWVDLS